MTDALAHRPSDPFLVVDVTPWWWKDYWATQTMLTALRAMHTLAWLRDSMITLTAGQIMLRFDVEADRLSALHAQISELQLFLNEMVVPAPVPGVEHESDGLE